MIGRCVAAAFGAVAVAMAAGCGGSTSGMATAPDDVTPYTSTTSTSTGAGENLRDDGPDHRRAGGRIR